MLIYAAFVTLASLCLCVNVLPTYPAYTLTQLSVFSGQPNPMTPGPGNTNFTLNVWDHNRATNASTRCNAVWSADMPAPTGWIPCEDPSFAFRFPNFTNIFTINFRIKHTFEDKKTGNPQNDMVMTVGNVTVNAPSQLSGTCNGHMYCTFFSLPSWTLPVPIIRAKKV